MAALLEAKANEAQTTAAAAASQVSSNSNGNGGVEPKGKLIRYDNWQENFLLSYSILKTVFN